MSKYRFKYVCDECGSENWILRRELIRAGRPRCEGCGSLALAPSAHSEVRSRLLEGQAACEDQKSGRRFKRGERPE